MGVGERSADWPVDRMIVPGVPDVGGWIIGVDTGRREGKLRPHYPEWNCKLLSNIYGSTAFAGRVHIRLFVMDWKDIAIIVVAAIIAGIFAPKLGPHVVRWLEKIGKRSSLDRADRS